MPLPLVRITSASHLEKSDTDGSIGDPSPLYYKPRPVTQSLKKSPTRLGRRKGLGLTKEEMQIKPSVLKKAVKTAYKADFAKHSEDLAELENILATVGKLQ